VVWAFLKRVHHWRRDCFATIPRYKQRKGTEPMDSLMIVGLLAAFVWIQMLTPPPSAEQKDNMAIRKARGEDDK